MFKYPESFTEMTEVAPGASLMDVKRTTRLFLTGSEAGSFSKKEMEVHLKRKARIARRRLRWVQDQCIIRFRRQRCNSRNPILFRSSNLRDIKRLDLDWCYAKCCPNYDRNDRRNRTINLNGINIVVYYTTGIAPHNEGLPIRTKIESTRTTA